MKLLVLVIVAFLLLFLSHKYVYHTVIDKLIFISLILCCIVTVLFPGIYYELSYEKQKPIEVTISAMDEKNKNAENSEILLRYIEVDGKQYDAYKYISEGNWIYYADGILWRNYDTDEDLSSSIKLEIPEGGERKLIFQSNLWRGMASIQYEDEIKICDFYSTATDSNHLIEVDLSSETFFSQQYKWISFLVFELALFLIMLSCLIFLDTFTKKRIRFNEVAYFASFMLIALLCTSVFTNSPWSKVHPWTDSDVFLYNGYALSQGEIMYRDFFDHKGPVLQFIEYIGYMISESYIGVWYIEFFLLSLTFFVFFKTIGLVTTNKIAFACTILTINTIPKFLEYGNYIESYALLFIAVSLYIFLEYFIKNATHISTFKAIVCGMCFTCAFLLRQNMIALWIVFCPIIFFQMIFRKNISQAFIMLRDFILGCIIVIIPLFVYLIQNNCIEAFWECCFIFNFKYIESNGLGSSILAAKYFSLNYNFLFAVLPLVVIALKKEKLTVENKFLCVLSIYILLGLSLYFTCLSGYTWLHYGLNLYPSYIATMVLMGNIFSNFVQDSLVKIKYIAICFIIIMLIFPGGMLSNFQDKHWTFSAHFIDIETKEICHIIKQNTVETDRISVCGNNNKIYLLSDRLSATRLSYSDPIVDVNSKYMNEYLHELGDKKPKMIVLNNARKEKDEDRITKFVTERYTLIYEGLDCSLYMYGAENSEFL